MYLYQSALSRDQVGRICSQKNKGSCVLLFNQKLEMEVGAVTISSSKCNAHATHHQKLIEGT